MYSWKKCRADDVVVHIDQTNAERAGHDDQLGFVSGFAYSTKGGVDRLSLGSDDTGAIHEVHLNIASPGQAERWPDNNFASHARFSLTFEWPEQLSPIGTPLIAHFTDGKSLEIARLVRPIKTVQLEYASSDVFNVSLGNQSAKFVVMNRQDSIQGWYHSCGKLYESELLNHLKHLVAPRSTILDVGANVGNHTVFFASEMNAARVIPFEPNPEAYSILAANVEENDLKNVELDWIGYCISTSRERFDIVRRPEQNLGGTRYDRSTSEEAVESFALDDLSLERADLIKIDVEGMEFDTLSSAQQLVARSKPVIAVEFTPATRDALAKWKQSNSYVLERRFSMYKDIWTDILVPE